VVARARADEALLAPLHEEGPGVAAQAVYAGASEFACTADDVLRRRTTVAYRGLATSDVVARVEALLERARTRS
jgi:glycerol-3-phosphate dehydrogenase